VTDLPVTGGIRSWDVAVNRWLVGARTETWDSLSGVGSNLAGTPTVVGVGVLVVGVLWWSSRDVESIGVLVLGLTLETSVFVTTTLFVARGRPPVRHLDAAPPTSSFPSGHAAAAVALYVALAVVIHRRWGRERPPVSGACVLLLLVPLGVALSRTYRGMHQPSDVLVGLVLGTLCVLVADRIVGRARLEACAGAETRPS
jgi:undecaprenyl-diphosphatase